MCRSKVSNKGELERLAREYALLVALAERADRRGDDDTANKLTIQAEIAKGRLSGRKLA